MKRYLRYLVLCLGVLFLGFNCSTTPDSGSSYDTYAEMRYLFEDGMVAKWYPNSIDREHGGFLSNLEYNWQPSESQEKMVVTQARHLWSLSKIAALYPDKPEYREYADHGYRYLRDVMWDGEAGGFYNLRTREGGAAEASDYFRGKRTYGQAFGLYALAAYARLTQSPEALEFAKKVFRTIEQRAFDSLNNGYYQFLLPGEATDAIRSGYKDQNTTIHLLEAYSEFYRIWPNDTLRSKLENLLVLVRDTITTEKGSLNLFFQPDWRPVSYHDSTQRNYDLDHVSFGHDIETAFLLLDAADALGEKSDARTLSVAEKLVRHSLEYGIDTIRGGLYERGYYEDGNLRIIDSSKNWWSQAEGMNTLLLFDSIYPDKGYRADFNRLWHYVEAYFLDPEFGGWYEMGIDKDPGYRTARKAHIWKGPYHTFRSVIRCMAYLERG